MRKFKWEEQLFDKNDMLQGELSVSADKSEKQKFESKQIKFLNYLISTENWIEAKKLNSKSVLVELLDEDS